MDRVGLDDDFFALGGNSLIATRVAARLGQALDAQVPVRVLFEASSVELLAARVESEVGSGCAGGVDGDGASGADSVVVGAAADVVLEPVRA